MPDYDDVERELAQLRQQLKKFRIIGSASHGSFEHGFVIGGEGGGGGGGGGGGPPPPPATGACCIGEACSIQTAAGCATMSGIYLGDSTLCSPNPCITTGACCIFGVCTDNYDPDACVADGGEFQGLGIHCADITCRSCCQGFVGYTDSTTHYLTETLTRRTTCGSPDVVCTYVQIRTFDLASCTASTGPLMDDPSGCESLEGMGDCFSICSLPSSGYEAIIDDNTHAHFCDVFIDSSAGEWVLSDPFTDCV